MLADSAFHRFYWSRVHKGLRAVIRTPEHTSQHLNRERSQGFTHMQTTTRPCVVVYTSVKYYKTLCSTPRRWTNSELCSIWTSIIRKARLSGTLWCIIILTINYYCCCFLCVRFYLCCLRRCHCVDLCRCFPRDCMQELRVVATVKVCTVSSWPDNCM